ncbi:MAG: hypothetical protein RLZZ511_2822 [Cyanobacteriota bacterium]|jgi:hypothetical protein
MQRNPQPDYFTIGKWTVRDLLHHIHRKTGRTVPYPTIEHWRKHLDIKPDSDMLYTDYDREGLIAPARRLGRGGKVKPDFYSLKFFL